jgi:hypothetical protein
LGLSPLQGFHPSCRGTAFAEPPLQDRPHRRAKVRRRSEPATQSKSLFRGLHHRLARTHVTARTDGSREVDPSLSVLYPHDVAQYWFAHPLRSWAKARAMRYSAEWVPYRLHERIIRSQTWLPFRAYRAFRGSLR